MSETPLHQVVDPYLDKSHRKGCGCARPECVELKQLRAEAMDQADRASLAQRTIQRGLMMASEIRVEAAS